MITESPQTKKPKFIVSEALPMVSMPETLTILLLPPGKSFSASFSFLYTIKQSCYIKEINKTSLVIKFKNDLNCFISFFFRRVKPVNGRIFAEWRSHS